MAYVLALLGAMTGATAQQEPVYPGRSWAVKTPAEVGLDAASLEALAAFVGGRGCVVRHGYLAYTWGDPGERADVASACKPWYAHFLLRAIEDGRLRSVDEPVARFEPRLNDLNPDLGFKDRDITWRHLANQTSCYGVGEPPGTAFDYNDWQMTLFLDTLFLKVYGATWGNVDETVLHPLLTDVLQCEDDPTFLDFGLDDRPGRLGVSVRDFARFGLLYLCGGRWRDRQLLSEEDVAMAVGSPLPSDFPRTAAQEAAMIPGQRSLGSRRIPDDQCDHLGSYSWLWWLNGVDREGGRHWPDAPADTFGAFGHGGPRAMVVMPSLDLIVSWNDANVTSREAENHALGMLADAVVQAEPQAGQVVADPEHPQWLWREGVGPLFVCGPGDPEGFLYRGRLQPDGTRDGDQRELVRQLGGTGANCIYVQAIRSHGGDGDPTHNPFIGNDPARGLNEKVLVQWETWFAELDRQGVVIFLIIYDDSALVWDTGDEVGTPEREFLRTLVRRFDHHRRLIWCVAEEYGEALGAARVRSIAAEIRAADRHVHPIAVHLNHGLNFRAFADDPCLDQFAIQYNVDSAEALHDGVVQAWREAAGRYNLNLAEAADWGTGATARQKSWACALGGAYVMVLGMDIEHTDRSDLEDCGRLVRFMESVDLRDMAPHDELAAGATQYVLARAGEAYVAYAAQAGGRLGLRGLSAGTYRLTWLDCMTGRSVTEDLAMERGGDALWVRPEGIGPEVALYARRG